MSTDITVTSCILAWNEKAMLREVVMGHLSTLRTLGVPHEVLIIDDGSTDGTGTEADELATEYRDLLRVVHHGENRGLGEAYRSGLTSARGKFVTFFPADGQFPATIIERFYPLAEEHDLVLGHLAQGRDSIVGLTLSRLERLLYRVLFGRVPRLEGVFMLRRELLGRFPLKSQGRGWAIVWELVLRAHRAGCRLVGVPTTMVPRVHGRSKVNNFRNIHANVRQVLALRRLLRDSG